MESSTIQQGRIIDRYTVESVLGEGGMAIVYRVRHNALGTTHALKVLTMSSHQIRARLQQEGRFQAQLQHPNIVAVTDVIDLDGAPGLIMEYIDGPSLDAFIHRGSLTVPQIDELAAGIFAGVAEAHRQGFIHRDLKPANVLLKVTEQGLVPKVADFGLAKALSGSDPGSARTRTGSTMGTPHYMSPEQVRDAKNVGSRSDIFALGAILYELVTAKRAFGGEDLLDIFNSIAHGRYTPVRELVADVPERMVAAIDAALKVNPEERPASVEALALLWRGGIPLATSSPGAFDMAQLATSFSSSLNTGSAPLSQSTGEATWNGTLPNSAPPAIPSRVGAVWAIGLGGTVFAVMIVVAAGLLLVMGGLWVAYTNSATEVAAIPVIVATVEGDTPAPANEPAATSAEPLLSVDPAEPPAPVSPPAPASPPAPGAPASPPAPSAPASPPAPEQPLPATPVAPTADDPPDAPPVVPLSTNPPPVSSVRKELELTPFLASPDPAERKRGIDNLANRNDDEALKLLDKMIREDKEQSVRRYAWDTAKRLYEARASNITLLEGIIIRMMGHPSAPYAIDAAQAYGRWGTNAQKMKAAIEHSHADVRKAAVIALPLVIERGGGCKDCAALIAPLLEDSDENVQRKARETLSRY